MRSLTFGADPLAAAVPYLSATLIVVWGLLGDAFAQQTAKNEGNKQILTAEVVGATVYSLEQLLAYAVAHVSQYDEVPLAGSYSPSGATRCLRARGHGCR